MIWPNCTASKPLPFVNKSKGTSDDFQRTSFSNVSAEEAETLVSQIVIPSRRSLGGSLPYVFTQEGVAMLSSVLKSTRAVQVNIVIMRAFVQLRRFAATHKDLAQKIQPLEQKYGEHDHDITTIFKRSRNCSVRRLSNPRIALDSRRTSLL